MLIVGLQNIYLIFSPPPPSSVYQPVWFPHSPSLAGITAPQLCPHKRANEQWCHRAEARRSCTISHHACVVTNIYIKNTHSQTCSVNANTALVPQCHFIWYILQTDLIYFHYNMFRLHKWLSVHVATWHLSTATWTFLNIWKSKTPKSE